MPRFPVVALLVAVSVAHSASGDAAPADGLSRIVTRLQAALELHDPAAYEALLAPEADRSKAARFTAAWFTPEITRAAIRERNRSEIAGSKGSQYELFLDVLVESGRDGRLGSWRVVAQSSPEAAAAADAEWSIADEEAIATVEGLHKLSLDSGREYAFANLTIRAEDLELSLPSGTAFIADTRTGPAAMVLLGRGEAIFSPRPEAERGQVKIFCGSEVLRTPFEALYIRANPDEIENHLSMRAFKERAADPRELKRADEVFRRAVTSSYNLDLGDLSRDVWSARPRSGDFLVDILTPRYADLTYAQFTEEPEDIQLFQRARNLTISAYASRDKLAARGPFYDEDDARDYDILDYDIDASFQPAEERIDARARLLIRTKRQALETIALRLADSLAVRSVTSRRLGYLPSLRVAGQNQIIVSMPRLLPRDSVIDVEVAYSGTLHSTPPEYEMLPSAARTSGSSPAEPLFRLEPSYVFSYGSYWYPQGMVTDYGTATMVLRVPPAYDSVASGELDDGYPRLVPPAGPGDPGWKESRFLATQPVRYLGWTISRFARVGSSLIESDLSAGLASEPGMARTSADLPGASYSAVQLVVDANPSLLRRARDITNHAAQVLKFYASAFGDIPYPSLTVALVERDTPGGHSPPYVALLDEPVGLKQVVWSTDPTSFANFPDFFLAHEVAHQWWGDAIGWKNAHEQWLGEALAQYSAALFAEQFNGRDVFAGIIRQMRQWTMRASQAGPVYLGSRLGRIQGDPRIYRAIVYNKGALVLHMARRLVGDDAFFRALRRFYATWRFQKAGTEDLRRALEVESHRPLDRFFDQWIYGSSLPTIGFSYQVEPNAVVLRFEQRAGVFDIPVTATLHYRNGSSSEVVVPLTDKVTELRVPVGAPVRQVEVNRNEAAPARFEKLNSR